MKYEISGNVLGTARSILTFSAPTDILKDLFDQLAPAFIRAMVESRKELERQLCRPFKDPLDILFEVIVAERRRGAGRPKHHAAVAKRAAHKRVAV
jgi:hypothetical protein